MEKYFNGNDIRIIAEPGQFYVSSAFTITTNIISKKIVDKEIENITAGVYTFYVFLTRQLSIYVMYVD